MAQPNANETANLLIKILPQIGVIGHTQVSIYAALEHLIRTKLREKEMYFPDMKKKPTQNPTAKWVFSCFAGVHELSVGADIKVILNLNERQKIILNCLGDRYWGVYS